MQSSIPFILQNFLDTEGVDFTIETLQSGHINNTYKICLPDGSTYILQQINTAIFPKPERIMANIEIVANHLKSNAIYQRSKRILQFLKTKSGEDYVKFQPNTIGTDLKYLEAPPQYQAWRLCPFFENTYSVLKVASTQQAYDAASAFGEYFACLTRLDVSKIQTIIPDFHNPDFRIQQFRDVFSASASRSPRQKSPMRQKPTQTLSRLQKSETALKIVEKYIPLFENQNHDIPKRIAHNDTKISNLLFDATRQKPVCVIDLDTLQVETVLSEFGDMLRSYTPQYDEDEKDTAKVNMRFDYFEAIAKGFLSQTQAILTPTEKSLLVYGGMRTVFIQALRFLTDYLNNDSYYKTQYPNHNLVRAENQLALFISIVEQREKMETYILQRN